MLSVILNFSFFGRPVLLNTTNPCSTIQISLSKGLLIADALQPHTRSDYMYMNYIHKFKRVHPTFEVGY